MTKCFYLFLSICIKLVCISSCIMHIREVSPIFLGQNIAKSDIFGSK